VHSIVDDASVYDQLKLLARFVRLAGYSGMLVCLDEMVNIYKLAQTQSRNANYEQILRIINDTFQGSSEGLGFIMGGTPEFLMDTRRGLYSYAALQSRLAENSYAKDGLVDFSGPVLRLANMTQEEFYVLLGKLRHVFASGDPAKYLVPDEALTAFMERSNRVLGAGYFMNPRMPIKAFLNVLFVIDQNPGISWRDVIEESAIEKDRPADTSQPDAGADDDDELANLTLGSPK
jgi:hypothetical protein